MRLPEKINHKTISSLSVCEAWPFPGLEEQALEFIEYDKNMFSAGTAGRYLIICSAIYPGSGLKNVLIGSGLFRRVDWMSEKPEKSVEIFLFKPITLENGEEIRGERYLGVIADDNNILVADKTGKIVADVPMTTLSGCAVIKEYRGRKAI
jgi:hypothetical protein